MAGCSRRVVATRQLPVHRRARRPTVGNSPGAGPAGWSPTPAILIPNLEGGLLPQQLTLRVPTEGVPARWGIDDVYVDPFRPR